MPKSKTTHYETLGIKPDAKHTEIGLAFNRRLSKHRGEDAPPDPRGEEALREAYAVLSDLDQREAYDHELLGERLKPTFGPKQGMIAAGFVVLIVGGITWFLLRRDEAAAVPRGRSLQEIAATATTAVGRLQGTDMSGQSKPIGLAFAIDAGVMVASCEGIAPNVQLTVNMNPRVVPARLTMTDEGRGLCRLEVEGAGSWPLPVAGTDARAGDIVYATSVNAVGEVVLKEGRVKSIVRNGSIASIDASVGPVTHGAPLLDQQGRVVGVVAVAAGSSRYVVLPRQWTEAPKPSAPAATPASPVSAPEGSAPADAATAEVAEGDGKQMAISKTGKPLPVTQERADRLNKAFRPPPNVPKDLE